MSTEKRSTRLAEKIAFVQAKIDRLPDGARKDKAVARKANLEARLAALSA